LKQHFISYSDHQKAGYGDLEITLFDAFGIGLNLAPVSKVIHISAMIIVSSAAWE